jgi:uncharacterized protein (TIGR02118 family)
MITVSFLYPDREGAVFDEAYYTGRHIPRVQELWSRIGLTDIAAFARIDDAAASGPFRAISMLSFESREQYDAALAHGGAELMADIANFTNIKPIAQISRTI